MNKFSRGNKSAIRDFAFNSKVTKMNNKKHVQLPEFLAQEPQKMKFNKKGIIALIVFTGILVYSGTSKAAPLEMGDGNRTLLQNSYNHYQFHNRYDRYSLNVIRGVYAQERARQVCTNWQVNEQSKFDTCVLALSSDSKFIGG